MTVYSPASINYFRTSSSHVWHSALSTGSRLERGERVGPSNLLCGLFFVLLLKLSPLFCVHVCILCWLLLKIIKRLKCYTRAVLYHTWPPDCKQAWSGSADKSASWAMRAIHVHALFGVLNVISSDLPKSHI